MLTYHQDPVLERRRFYTYPNTHAGTQSKFSHLEQDSRNQREAGTPNSSTEVQVPHYYDHANSRLNASDEAHPSAPLHNDKGRVLASLRAQYLLLVGFPVSQDVSQRVPPVSNNPLRRSPPSPGRLEQRKHLLSVNSLLNPTERDDRVNPGGAPKFLSEQITSLPCPALSYDRALWPTNAPHLGSQEAFRPQEQAWGYPGSANFATLQPIDQSRSQVGYTKPTTLPCIATSCRTQLPFPDTVPSSSAASTVPHKISDERLAGQSTQSLELQSKRTVMALGSNPHPIHVPADAQAASKAVGERRKRRAITSYQYRQRKKKEEQETSRNIANLEKELRETKEKVDFYLSERNYFRDLAWRQHQGIPQRPLSPKVTRHGTPGKASIEQH
ncbi:MAG: hypothetical protein Q9225_004383 [Loekoesia sp. 1 TL-2023]